MKVKYQLLANDAKCPFRASDSAAGWDLFCTHYEVEGSHFLYHTGVAVEIPEGYAGFIFPRSSVYKTGMSLSNCVGVIDSDYRGEIMLRYRIDVPRDYTAYQKGDRCGQLVVMPVANITFELVDELSDTKRGGGGFGSTGK